MQPLLREFLMTVTFFTVILPLSGILVGSLYMSKTATRMQEDLLQKLQRLTSLERRRISTRDAIRVIEAMDDDPDLLKALYASLKADLMRLRELDPGRPGIDAEINQASPRATPGASNVSDPNRAARLEKMTSLPTMREVAMTGGVISEAMNILRRLSRYRKISSVQFEAARNRLRYLSAMISVNSSIRMAQLAAESHDHLQALTCYRKAETVLQMGVLTGKEKAEKAAQIAAEKSRLYETSANRKGMMLLSAQR
jgi:hypothetical protein